jgi:hypothetical protein
LSNFNESWIFSADFSKKKAQISSFIEFRPVGAELLHNDVLFNDGHVEYAETRSIKQRDNNCVT